MPSLDSKILAVRDLCPFILSVTHSDAQYDSTAQAWDYYIPFLPPK